MYLLDTDICIYIMKQKPVAVEQRFQSVKTGSVYISVVSVAELKAGARKSQSFEENNSKLELFLSPLKILSFDYEAAEAYGMVRDNLRRAGNIIGPYDLQIAAQALARNFILVTNNMKEFNRVEGLTVENWA